MVRRLLILTVLVLLSAVFAMPVTGSGAPQSTPGEANKLCLECHTIPNRQITLPSGESLSLVIDGDSYAQSLHGQHDIRCIDCHTNIAGYPHPPLKANDYRDFQFDRYRSCFACHSEQYQGTLDSIHAQALAGGNREAAICTDCHGAHDVSSPDEPRQKISLTCSQCHAAIFEQYRHSVHGAALSEQGNPDVPTCVDCHSVHHIEEPHSAAFRLRTPEICGRCHADKALMAKYGISTAVFDTYVADFHGTTVQIFESTDPDAFTNKAVCTDCHGTHNILEVSDANSSVLKENLLTTCQRCHPDADESFTASWMGHYPPDWQHYPVVTFVNWFYRLLIPAVLSFFVIFIGADAGRTALERSRQRRAWRLAQRKKKEKQGGDQ